MNRQLSARAEPLVPRRRIGSSTPGKRAPCSHLAGTAYTLALTVHLQTGVGYSPLRAALSMVAFTVGVGGGSAIAPYLLASAPAFVLPPGRVTVDLGPAETAAVTSADPAAGPAVEVS